MNLKLTLIKAMSATTSSGTATGSSKTGGQNHGAQLNRANSQGPRVNQGSPSGGKRSQSGGQKGDFKGDGARKSPQGSANGQHGKKAQPNKSKPSSQVSDYLRQRGATAEIASLVAQIRSEFNGYYSEEQVFNTLSANNGNADATRSALSRTHLSYLV